MMRWIRHCLRVLFTGSSFVYFFTGGAILAAVFMPLSRLTKGTPAEKAERCREWLRKGWVSFHAYMRIFGLIDWDPRRLTQPMPDGPLVVVSNHPTLVDVTAIISAWSRLVCVAKPLHFRTPFIGRLLRYCGYIEGGDGLFSSATVVTSGIEALKQGAAILVFPEGTRSPMNKLREFKQGAFEMAARAGAPILPILVTCDPPTLMRDQPWYDVPVRTAVITITPLPLISAAELGDPAEAARRLQQQYQARLDAFLAARDPSTLPAQPAQAQADQVGQGG
jgi:1-acyl-sn-glycerol-3-phosphate acyltransferase